MDTVVTVMGQLVECNTCFTAFSIFSMDHNQGVFQLTKEEANYAMSKQVKKHMHTLTILASSPEFYLWKKATLTTQLSGINDLCIGEVSEWVLTSSRRIPPCGSVAD
jgi:hypothetical protein